MGELHRIHPTEDTYYADLQEAYGNLVSEGKSVSIKVHKRSILMMEVRLMEPTAMFPEDYMDLACYKDVAELVLGEVGEEYAYVLDALGRLVDDKMGDDYKLLITYKGSVYSAWVQGKDVLVQVRFGGVLE